MNITELEIHNICECRHALLRIPPNPDKAPLYIVRSKQYCEVVTLSLQLICGVKYSNYTGLHEIRDKIVNGKIKITFTLMKSASQQNAEKNSVLLDHSSDSDVPCTSHQASQRLKRRLERRREMQKKRVVKACRDFTVDPDVIIYTVDNGPTMECSVAVFQVRFFSCTDLIFPRLINVTHGEYCNGRWLDLLSTDFVHKGIDENYLLQQFCKLYANRKISQNHFLSELTTSVLTGRSYLNNSRISHLINIFNDIRWLFEYMTCSEYTVWFLLPTVYGNLQDISKITTDNIHFDLMITEIQLKQKNASPFPWTRAEKHVQELFLVAVQLSFGYHSHQNIIYLHSLNYLGKHQSFEFLNYSLIQSFSSRQLLFEKNYFHRIFNVCAKLNICCVLEYCGNGLPFGSSQAFVINCYWLDSSKEWKISTEICLSRPKTHSDIARKLLHALEENIK